MTYATGLLASKALKEKGVEIESEKYWGHTPAFKKYNLFAKKELEYQDGWSLIDGWVKEDNHCQCVMAGTPDMDDFISSYSLSELAEVFKELGEDKGTRETIGGIYPIWLLEYLELCEVWATTQSQERCDEFITNLIKI